MSKRSINIAGTVTSISMEDAFWHELDQHAAARGKGWAEIVREWLATAPPSDNRSASIKEIIFYLVRSEVDQLRSDRSLAKATWQVLTPNDSAARTIQTLSARLVVGREPPAEMVIADAEVSKRHSMLVSDGLHWWLIDLKSKNGTYRAGKRVAFAELAPGNDFVIGKSRIKLVSSK